MQRPRGDRDHIGRAFEIDILDLPVNHCDAPFRGRERGKVGQRQRHHRPALCLEQLAA